MATKKKTTTKKAATKKAPAKKTTRAPRQKKEKIPYTANADRIQYFMGQLIQAGYLGDELPEESRDRRAGAQSLRQMAQQLDRQVHKTAPQG